MPVPIVLAIRAGVRNPPLFITCAPSSLMLS